MTTTILCPECTQPVAVPDSASSSAHVRCALCNAEFQLPDALSHDAPALALDAPELIVLSDPESPAAEPEALAMEELSLDELSRGEPAAEFEPLTALSELEADGIPVAEGDDAPVDFTTFHEEAAEGESPVEFQVDDEASPSAADLTQAEDELQWETSGGENSNNEASLDGGHDSAELENTAVDPGDDADPGDAEREDLDDSADTEVSSTVGTKPGKQKKKRRGPGPIGHFVGIVVFGLFGIALAYFIVRLIKPDAVAEVDKTIAAYVPWWGGATQTPPSVVQNGGNSKPAGTPDASNPSAQTGQPPNNITPKQEPTAVNPTPPLLDSPPVPPVQEKVPEPAFTGPITPESATPAELLTAVTTANQAVGQLRADEFTALCDLGHAVALVENSKEPKAAELRLAATSILLHACSPQRRQRIGYFSHAWLFDPRRPANRSGVWLVGRVESVDTLKTPQGNLTKSVIAVQGQKGQANISVLSVERPNCGVGDMVGVLGTIITKPATRLPWYNDAEPLVVISGVAIKLPEN